MFDNNLISGAKQLPVKVFTLQLVIDSATRTTTYNQLILPMKTTQNNIGVTYAYDPHQDRNVQIVCNNRDVIDRKVVDDGAYITYSVHCTKERIPEFKEHLVKYAKLKESELLTKYQKAVETKTEILSQLDAYLAVAPDPDDEDEPSGTTSETPEGV